ncbi:hypothetical protein EV384_6110 [Micromonospora kangleipakensis]|uniref:Uncharacterized protein n=1 Tax=Micromonospora kangleipakensis TaxID=1077942 RepID=A0A4Q8BIL9_9ACTN|nr:hypothetical protein [Micromonospora kangleipakensis]RZU77391.1 hypothetical protein EV384_6110 [Micromonospora kangleipakensis]
MSVDELRAGLARVAASVVLDDDPYGRLMRHARRRRRNRWSGAVALLAGLLATVVFAPALGLRAGGLGDLFRDPERGSGYPVTDDWVWRLIDSPTRGSLATDGRLVDELTSVFDRDRDEAGMGSALPTVKVLFADDSFGARQVVVAYHSDTSAALVATTGAAGSSPRDLVRTGGISNVRISPFTVIGGAVEGKGDTPRWLLGLAPAGCAVSSAGSATVSPEGTVRRTWRPTPTPGYLLLDGQRIRGWWRVECDGRIREQGPVGFGTGEISGRDSAPASDPSAGAGGPLTVGAEIRQAEEAAMSSWGLLVETTGLSGDPGPVRRWRGRVPGGDGTGAALVGPASGTGPAVLQVGASYDALVALAAPDGARPDDTETRAASRTDWALVSTVVGSSPDLIAVRVPTRVGGHAALTDQLLVVPEEEDAARVEVVGPGTVRSSAPVTNGAAVVALPLGEPADVRALDAAGRVLASIQVREPERGGRLFGEGLVSDW